MLLGKGVPVKFINRVLECLRGERQQVLWKGELSNMFQRRRGIKQGCPLSPFIFNLIIEAVLESVEDDVDQLRLNQEGRLTLPILFVFADDILIVSERVEDVENIVAKLKDYLNFVGLNLNAQKCKVLVRNPNAPAVDSLTICGTVYKTTDPLRYLGIFLTSRLERPLTLRARCRNAVQVSKAIMDFLKRYKPSWEIGRIIYETVIAPAMIYGTQAAVLTKYSRRSIRGYESQIVQGMATLCRNDQHTSPAKTVNALLNKRRITKKIRMYQMRYWGHIRRKPRDHPLRAAARLRATRLRPCRPSFTWWESIESNVRRYGSMTYDEWKSMAKDRDKFHGKLLDIYNIQESDSSSWGMIAISL